MVRKKILASVIMAVASLLPAVAQAGGLSLTDRHGGCRPGERRVGGASPGSLHALEESRRHEPAGGQSVPGWSATAAGGHCL